MGGGGARHGHGSCGIAGRGHRGARDQDGNRAGAVQEDYEQRAWMG